VIKRFKKKPEQPFHPKPLWGGGGGGGGGVVGGGGWGGGVVLFGVCGVESRISIKEEGGGEL